DLRLQFGLGDAKTIERVVVRWPKGAEETWTGLAVDRMHTLIEGNGSH
ncbi:MAG: ASPIC/UnbV domain-containing protein, partial [Acidobacteria bacterium]|nr:ASPIC/UnbV domain-containing protein [Acidobacteriota bacterium]